MASLRKALEEIANHPTSTDARALKEIARAALATEDNRKAKRSTYEFYRSELAAQKTWVHEHGGDELGYVLRYGSKDDPKHYGDGGEAIYAADKAHLDKLRAIVTEMEEK